MTQEDEEFNRIERESHIKQEYVRDIQKRMDELAVARVLVRELGDRLAKLEKPWVGLTIQDVKVIERNSPSKQMAILMAEATLKEKNT